MIVLDASAKYSSPPSTPLAGYLDQSPRTDDYRPSLPALPRLRRDFLVTSTQFP